VGFFCCGIICSLYILFHFCFVSAFLVLDGLLLLFCDFVIDFCCCDRLTPHCGSSKGKRRRIPFYKRRVFFSFAFSDFWRRGWVGGILEEISFLGGLIFGFTVSSQAFVAIRAQGLKPTICLVRKSSWWFCTKKQEREREREEQLRRKQSRSSGETGVQTIAFRAWKTCWRVQSKWNCNCRARIWRESQV